MVKLVININEKGFSVDVNIYLWFIIKGWENDVGFGKSEFDLDDFRLVDEIKDWSEIFSRLLVVEKGGGGWCF